MKKYIDSDIRIITSLYIAICMDGNILVSHRGETKMTKQEIINATFKGGLKLDKDTIKSLKLTTEELKEIKATVKEMKTAKRLEVFRAENCVMTYKGKEIAFNPRGVEGKKIIVWTNIDKNAIVYAMPNLDGNVSIKVTSKVWNPKNNGKEFADALVSANKNKVIAMVTDITNGLDFNAFYNKCTTFKSWKVLACNGVYKTIDDTPKATPVKKEKKDEKVKKSA